MRGILLILVCMFLTGCGSLISWPAGAPKPPQKLFQFSQRETSTPVFVGMIDGKPVVANQTDRVYSTNQQVTEKELTFFQRVARFGWWLIIGIALFVFVSLYYFAGRPIVKLYQSYKDMKAALKNTVAAIKELPPTTYEEVTDALSKKQDKKDKVLVDQIKSELH